MVRSHLRIGQLFLVIISGALVVGCGDDPSPDAGPGDDQGTEDSGLQLDSSVLDLGVPTDMSVRDLGPTVDTGTGPVDLGVAVPDLGPPDPGVCSGSVSFNCTQVSPLDCARLVSSGCTQGDAVCADDAEAEADIPAFCMGNTTQARCEADGAYCSWNGSSCVAHDACTSLSNQQCAGGTSVDVGGNPVAVSCFAVRECLGTGTFDCSQVTTMSACVVSGCTWTPN